MEICPSIPMFDLAGLATLAQWHGEQERGDGEEVPEGPVENEVWIRSSLEKISKTHHFYCRTTTFASWPAARQWSCSRTVEPGARFSTTTLPTFRLLFIDKQYFQLLQKIQKIFSTSANSSKKVFSTLANSSEGVGRSVRPPAHGRHAVHHVRQAAGQLHQVQGDLISLSTCSLLTESCLSGLEPHRRDPWQDQRDTGKQGHPSNCCQHQGNDNTITKNTKKAQDKKKQL